MSQKNENQNFSEIQERLARPKGQTVERKGVAPLVVNGYSHLFAARPGEARGNTDDVKGGVAVKILQAAKTPRVFNTEPKFVAWLKKVVRSVKVDRVRKELRNTPLAQPSSGSVSKSPSSSDRPERRQRVSHEQIEQVESSESDALLELENQEHDRKLLYEFLETLKPQDRKLLLLGADDNLDWRKVGEELGKDPDAARVQYGRLISRLRQRATGESAS